LKTQNIQHFENEKLIDLIKNYRYYGLTLAHKTDALNLLKQEDKLNLNFKMSGDLTNLTMINEPYSIIIEFKENSNLELALNSNDLC
jgi:lipopolysaccharide export system permease protein